MNRDRHVVFASPMVTVLLLLVGGCGADDQADQTATVKFESSSCKSRAPAAGAALTATLPDNAAHAGLSCASWETGPNTTTFRLSNVEGACGAGYQGRAFVDDGGKAITLSLTNPSGAVAACGWCLYDFAFEVRGVAAGASLAVTVERSNSAVRGAEGSSRFTLAAAGRTQGVTCRYGNRFAMADHGRKTGTGGTRNMPCDLVGMPDVAACATGLTCLPVDTAGEHRICLAGCSTASDCGDGQLYTCAAGACRLVASGE